jgi:SSU ribosomal protein S12P methylthiotransferase (EC 2.-.-.-)
VIPMMAEGKILPYLDIPFQHASPRILKAMKRPAQPKIPWRAYAHGARFVRSW